MLAAHFIQHSAANPTGRPITVSSAGMRLLRDYDWPTNVRQLRNVIERSLVEAGPHASRIGVEIVRDAMQAIGAAAPGRDVRAGDGSRAHLVATLAACDWEVDRAAEALGVNRTTIYRWMRRLGVRRPVIRVRRGG
jgi:transcriptional regulator of acetoin/glycerol metabolism